MKIKTKIAMDDLGNSSQARDRNPLVSDGLKLYSEKERCDMPRGGRDVMEHGH